MAHILTPSESRLLYMQQQSWRALKSWQPRIRATETKNYRVQFSWGVVRLCLCSTDCHRNGWSKQVDQDIGNRVETQQVSYPHTTQGYSYLQCELLVFKVWSVIINRWLSKINRNVIVLIAIIVSEIIIYIYHFLLPLILDFPNA